MRYHRGSNSGPRPPKAVYYPTAPLLVLKEWECACVTGCKNLRVFGRSSRHSGRTLAVERPLFWSLWDHKKIISPGITDFIVSLLSSVKSVRFPWPFTLKKMPANNKKILSPACVNKVLIGSFIISNDDGDGDGESTEKGKKAVILD